MYLIRYLIVFVLAIVETTSLPWQITEMLILAWWLSEDRGGWVALTVTAGILIDILAVRWVGLTALLMMGLLGAAELVRQRVAQLRWMGVVAIALVWSGALRAWRGELTVPGVAGDLVILGIWLFIVQGWGQWYQDREIKLR